MTTLAVRVEQLSPLKQALLQKLLREKQTPPRAIPRRSAPGEAPASFAQQRLWFLDQLQGDRDFFLMPTTLRLTGTLQIPALERALATIAERHETLRTTFTVQENQLYQVIHPTVSAPLTVIDLQDRPAATREAHARAVLADEGKRPFDLTQLPLFRTTLLRLGADDYLFHLVLHHSIADGWSMAVFVRELAVLYEAFSNNKPSPLPALAIQYADFALWQRGWLSGTVLERQLTYWKNQLSGAPPLRLPTDFQRPARQNFVAAVQPVHLSRDVTDTLKAFSRQEQCTLFMTLLAAWQTFLYRYTGQDDIVIGADIANRNQPEVEPLIGFFVNQLVVRTQLVGNPTFRTLLRQVRQVTLAGYDNQDAPFEMVVKAVQSARTHDSTPLFQVKFNLQTIPLPMLDNGDLTLNIWEAEERVAREDLTLLLGEGADGLIGELVYSTELFKADTIAGLGRGFVTVLQQISANPDALIDTLELLSAEERRERKMQFEQRESASRSKLRTIKRKTVNMPTGDLIKESYLQPEQRLPLVIEPATDDLNLIEWAQNNRDLLERKLLAHGGLLFRGFHLDAVTTFEPFALTIFPQLFTENGEHMAVDNSRNVQTPVFFSPAQKLLWHNENTFNYQWPLKIMFGCAQPATSGGETPIVDSRRLFDRLNPGLRSRFLERGIMYVRNYGVGLGLDWQTVFRTTDRAAVEAYCKANFMNFTWKGSDQLRTTAVRPAAIPHPKSGDMVWLNQAQHWHTACLDPAVRASLFASFAPEDLPRACYFGDGSPIEDAMMAEILALYAELEVSFPWQQGDVMLLDNALVAHARNPYQGPRKLLVAMGEMQSYAGL